MRPDPVTIDIGSGFYKGRSSLIQNQECINLVPTPVERVGLTGLALVSRRGIEEIANAGSTSYYCRGYHVVGETPYIILGNTLYSMGADYALASHGTIPGIAQLSLASNGTQLMILEPGGAGYIFNIDTGVLSVITDIDFRANGNPQFVVFIDSYFCCTTDTNRVIISSNNDGTNWAALDYTTAESDPDRIVAPAVISNTLIIWGTQTGEQFQNIGGAGFPFQRTGFVAPKGIKAAYSLKVCGDRAYFIGGGKDESTAVWMVSANGYEKVSTIPLDEMIQALTPAELDKVRSWAYSEKGSSFVGFALPDTTIVYDESTKLWTERKSYINNELTAWRVHSVFCAYGKIFCTDTYDGRIGLLSDTVHTEYGNRIIKRFTVAPFAAENFSLFIPMIELTIESGLLTQDDPDEILDMEQSQDTKRWGIKRSRNIGRTGKYEQRLIWTRNGRVPRFVNWRFSCSAAIPLVITSLKCTLMRGEK